MLQIYITNFEAKLMAVVEYEPTATTLSEPA